MRIYQKFEYVHTSNSRLINILVASSRKPAAGNRSSKLTNKGTGAKRLHRSSFAIRSAALRPGERPTSGSDEGTYGDRLTM